MFMFQSFSLAVFIPEIIMVLAYVFCLLGQTKSVEITDIASVEPKVAEAHFSTTTTTSAYHFDQQFIPLAENSELVSIVYPLTASQPIPEYRLFRLTNCLSFVQFSRPPPSFFI